MSVDNLRGKPVTSRDVATAVNDVVEIRKVVPVDSIEHISKMDRLIREISRPGGLAVWKELTQR